MKINIIIFAVLVKYFTDGHNQTHTSIETFIFQTIHLQINS